MANVYKNIQAVISAAGSDVDMYTSPDRYNDLLLKVSNYTILIAVI